MEKNPKSKYKIRFIDCDPFGHLTNSRYIDYMLNAREDHVNQAYDLYYENHSQETGCSWVTLKNQISYFREVKYGIQVEIDSKVIAFSDKKITVEVQMRNAKTQKLHALLWSEVIYFSLTKRKSAQHSSELMDMFSEIVVPLDNENFDTRINKLLSSR